jgi:hypothetical protein
MAGIFLSYRRRDSADAAQIIYTRLDTRFPRVPVFIDVDEIPPGRDFRAVIAATLRHCTVVLAIIGPDWAESRDADGRRRLDNPADFVRLELEAALTRGMKVIVALVGGAHLPDPQQLPPSLQALVRCPVVEVRPLPATEADLERLIQTMMKETPALTQWRPSYPRLTLALLALFPVLIPVGVVLGSSLLSGLPTPVPFALLVVIYFIVFFLEYACIIYIGFTAVRLGRIGWVVSMFVTLGLSMIVFGLVGPVKRAKKVNRPSLRPAWQPVGVQR